MRGCAWYNLSKMKGTFLTWGMIAAAVVFGLPAAAADAFLLRDAVVVCDDTLYPDPAVKRPLRWTNPKEWDFWVSLRLDGEDLLVDRLLMVRKWLDWKTKNGTGK